MIKPAIALAAAAAVAACLALTHAGTSAPGPCADSCNIPDHTHSSQQTVAMSDMPGMQMPNASSAATPAPGDERMSHGGHMTMTMKRPSDAADQARADQILATLRQAIAPYKDYRAAEAAGYVPFHPELPLPMYHFTNWANAAANVFSFDPARPTSLMYKRVPGGYELVGAMYTAPERATDDQLNARVPLSVATWHLHTNLCLPPAGQHVSWTGPNAQFGLAGSITTASACEAAGGTFKPIIYNWMVHVWPFETDPSKVWASEEHPGAM
ncbi:MAG: hypothetical protein JO219_02300 [Candidatus Eremiobacteraeota bacterium]|nr:hypothetical protein [Candidatus Eremiobacteraeota bacterium]